MCHFSLVSDQHNNNIYLYWLNEYSRVGTQKIDQLKKNYYQTSSKNKKVYHFIETNGFILKI